MTKLCTVFLKKHLTFRLQHSPKYLHFTSVPQVTYLNVTARISTIASQKSENCMFSCELEVSHWCQSPKMMYHHTLCFHI